MDVDAKSKKAKRIAGTQFSSPPSIRHVGRGLFRQPVSLLRQTAGAGLFMSVSIGAPPQEAPVLGTTEKITQVR